MVDMLELCRIRTAVKQPDGQKASEDLLRFAHELMGRGSLEDARRALDAAAAKNPGGADVAAAREELVRLETEKRLRVAQESANEAARLAAAKDARPSPRSRSPSPGMVPVAPSPGPRPRSEPAMAADSARERAAFEAFYSGVNIRPRPSGSRAGADIPADRAGPLLRLRRLQPRGRGAAAGAAGGSDLESARKLFADAGTAAARLVAQDGFVSPRDHSRADGRRSQVTRRPRDDRRELLFVRKRRATRRDGRRMNPVVERASQYLQCCIGRRGATAQQASRRAAQHRTFSAAQSAETPRPLDASAAPLCSCASDEQRSRRG